MKPDNTSNAGTSATTSSSAPRKNEAPPPGKPAAELSESEFLAQQAEAAKQAMAKAWSDFSSSLGKSADPRQWAKAHPWLTVAGATVAGFAAASALVPSKEEQALKKLAAIERALHSRRDDAEKEARNGDGDSPPREGFVSKLIHEAIGMLRPALVAMLTQGLHGMQPPPDPNQDPSQPGMPPGAGPYYQYPNQT